MKEYWNRPEATAETITQDGWLRTGDVATIDEDGYVYIQDRIKDMIISGGENVYPAEIENVILTHPDVAEVAVIGQPSEKWGESPFAIVVRKGESLADSDVIDHCNAIRCVLEAGQVGEMYNIGAYNEKTNLEVVNTICSILDSLKPREDGGSYKSQIKFVKDRLGHDKRYAINANKIEKNLNWHPSETLETGIKKTIQWYLDHQDWVTNITNRDYQTWVEKQYI